MFQQSIASHKPITTGVSSISTINFDLLFESVVCDLQWASLHAGALTSLVNGLAESPKGIALKSWRYVLCDDAAAMLLGLRYSAEMGLSIDVPTKIRDFYTDLAKLKAKLTPISRSTEPYTAQQRLVFQELAPLARRMCNLAITALESMEPHATRLDSRYLENNRVLVPYLRTASVGKQHNSNQDGQIYLPSLPQQRHAPRLLLQRPCQVLMGAIRISAVLDDISRTGLGLTISHELAPGQNVEVVFDDRAIKALVAWRRGTRAGLRMKSPLPKDDPIFLSATVVGR